MATSVSTKHRTGTLINGVPLSVIKKAMRPAPTLKGEVKEEDDDDIAFIGSAEESLAFLSHLAKGNADHQKEKIREKIH